MGNYYWRMVTDTVGHEEVKDYTVEDVLVGVIKYQVDEGLLRMFCEVCLGRHCTQKSDEIFI